MVQSSRSSVGQLEKSNSHTLQYRLAGTQDQTFLAVRLPLISKLGVLVIIAALNQLGASWICRFHGRTFGVRQDWAIGIVASHIWVLRILSFSVCQPVS